MNGPAAGTRLSPAAEARRTRFIAATSPTRGSPWLAARGCPILHCFGGDVDACPTMARAGPRHRRGASAFREVLLRDAAHQAQAGIVDPPEARTLGAGLVNSRRDPRRGTELRRTHASGYGQQPSDRCLAARTTTAEALESLRSCRALSSPTAPARHPPGGMGSRVAERTTRVQLGRWTTRSSSWRRRCGPTGACVADVVEPRTARGRAPPRRGEVDAVGLSWMPSSPSRAPKSTTCRPRGRRAARLQLPADGSKVDFEALAAGEATVDGGDGGDGTSTRGREAGLHLRDRGGRRASVIRPPAGSLLAAVESFRRGRRRRPSSAQATRFRAVAASRRRRGYPRPLEGCRPWTFREIEAAVLARRDPRRARRAGSRVRVGPRKLPSPRRST